MAAAYGAFAAVRDARLRALRRNLSDPPAAMLAAVLRRLAPAGRCVFMEMTIDGKDHLKSHWTFFDGGKPAHDATFELTRKSPVKA